jgi:transposase
MSGNGSNPTAEEIAAKEAQERELKAAQVGDLTGKAPSGTPSNIESSDDSSSDSDSDSDSSDEDVKDSDDAAKKAAKKRRKAKKKKKAKKEQAKYTHSGFYEMPHNYAQIPSNNSNEKFYSVHLGKPPHFDGED